MKLFLTIEFASMLLIVIPEPVLLIAMAYYRIEKIMSAQGQESNSKESHGNTCGDDRKA